MAGRLAAIKYLGSIHPTNCMTHKNGTQQDGKFTGYEHQTQHVDMWLGPGTWWITGYGHPSHDGNSIPNWYKYWHYGYIYMWYTDILVGGFNPLKNISQIGSSSQLLVKIKFMLQTTNQMIYDIYCTTYPFVAGTAPPSFCKPHLEWSSPKIWKWSNPSLVHERKSNRSHGKNMKKNM
jgi:hypothetical protein